MDDANYPEAMRAKLPEDEASCRVRNDIVNVRYSPYEQCLDQFYHYRKRKRYKQNVLHTLYIVRRQYTSQRYEHNNVQQEHEG